MRTSDKRRLQVAITGEQARKAVDQVVQARYGDQNAMGMIEEVRKSAEAGVEKAQNSYRIMLDYAAQNPPDEAMIGAETAHMLGTLKDPAAPLPYILHVLCCLPSCPDADAIDGAVCILSFGPPISTARLAAMGSHIPPPYQGAFAQGLANADDERALTTAKKNLDAAGEGFLCAGHVLGTARRIQQVRGGEAGPKVSGPSIGWEYGLGDDSYGGGFGVQGG